MDVKIILGYVLALLSCHSESKAHLQGEKTLTLEELIPLRGEFYPDRLDVQWVSETKYMYRDHLGIRRYDALNDVYETVLDAKDLDFLHNYTVTDFSTDGKYVLLARNKKKVYRHSTIAEYSVYDLERRTIKNIGQGHLQVVLWGSDKSLAYVQDNNVHYVPDVRQSEVVGKLTKDGVPGEVYFGVTDWVYEEEVLNTPEAMWFSPSGTYLAVASFNDTLVESVEYPLYGNPAEQYPEIVTFKYPKAGRTNPVVGLRVYKLDDPTAEPWNIPAPVDVVGLDHILGRVNWASNQNLVVLWLNRRQSTSILVNCDLKKDKCSMVKEQREPNGWVDITTPLFDETGNKMVEIQPLFHGEQRFPHAARFDFLSLATEDLSPGNSTVLEILGWNTKTDTVYYKVAPGHIPWLRQIWAATAGVVRCITCKEPSCRYVEAKFSPGAKYAMITCSACNIPPKTFLYDSLHDTFSTIVDNNRLSNKLQQYKLPMTLYNVLSLGDDILASAKLLLPPEVETGKKYPMIVRVYAGPGTTRVQDNYDTFEYYSTYLATNRSYIVANVDVRGSGVLGVEAMHAVNNQLGTVEISDTIDTIRSLVSLYSFIDPDRIGVWGWSYGGFATTMILVQDRLNTFKCGAAVAPVTSWTYYDSIYTERYMDTPQNNPTGYARSDLTSLAEYLRGKKYLLIHGTGDDNVQFQNSLQLAKELQHRDIEFEQMSYTDENHSLMGVNRHFYHTLDRFWTDCLK